MKNKKPKTNHKEVIREQILQSAIASFRIEGIEVSKEVALETLKKVEADIATEDQARTDFINVVLESEQEIKKGHGVKVSSKGFDNLLKIHAKDSGDFRDVIIAEKRKDDKDISWEDAKKELKNVKKL